MGSFRRRHTKAEGFQSSAYIYKVYPQAFESFESSRYVSRERCAAERLKKKSAERLAVKKKAYFCGMIPA